MKTCKRLMAVLAIATLLAAASSVVFAASTINVKTAGTITIDGATGDWNLAEFTSKTRGGMNETGDYAIIGWDGGTRYYGGYLTRATLPTNAADHTARGYSPPHST